MAAYPGGTQVKRGYYVHGKSFAFANVRSDGGALPGGSESRWVRVPVLAVMVAAPALGGLFILSLPVITFGMIAYAVVKKVSGGAKAGAKELAATVAPAWTPGEAHLAGQAPAGEAAESRPETTTAHARIEALAREIEAKRNAGS